jgi:hypothetical protein
MEPVALRLQVAPEEKMLWGEEEEKRPNRYPHVAFYCIMRFGGRAKSVK